MTGAELAGEIDTLASSLHGLAQLLDTVPADSVPPGFQLSALVEVHALRARELVDRAGAINAAVRLRAAGPR